MAKIWSAATRQAEGGNPPRIAAIYRELINELATNPEYDPSSEPLPIQDVSAPTTAQKGGRGRGRGRATTAAAATAAVDPVFTPVAPVDTPPVVEKPKAKAKAKAQPKAKAKRKPKMKPVPVPEPEPELELESESESEPELESVPKSTTNGKHTSEDATPSEKDINGDVQMEVATNEEPGPATGKRGKANQQAAKGGTKATQKGKAAAVAAVGGAGVQATTSATVTNTTTTAPTPDGPASRTRRKVTTKAK